MGGWDGCGSEGMTQRIVELSFLTGDGYVRLHMSPCITSEI